VARKKRLSTREVKKLASEQIIEYFEDIKRCECIDLDLMNRYVEICRGISKRCKVRIPKEYKMFICKKCKRYLIPGKTMRVRVRDRKSTHLVVTCLYCNSIKRYYIKRDKNGQRKSKKSMA